MPNVISYRRLDAVGISHVHRQAAGNIGTAEIGDHSLHLIL